MKQTALLGVLLALAGPAARAQDALPPPPPPPSADSEGTAPPPPPPNADDAGSVTAPATAAPDTSTDAGLRAEVAALKAQVTALQQRLDQMQGGPPAAPGTALPTPPLATETTPAAPPEGSPEAGAPAEASSGETPSGGGHQLLLPDISFIGTAIGHVSTDHRDAERSRLFLDSGEIGIQSYVYPGVKADAFITADHPDLTFKVEEAYLTLQNLAQGLSGQIGERKVPFDRVNQLHQHSWLYVVQPFALTDLVADESLVGQGGTLSYLLPTKGRFFAQLDGGLWNSAEPGDIVSPDSLAIRRGPGAAFEDRFQTARLWTGTSIGETAEVELGGSVAHGKGQTYINGNDVLDRPETTLSGVDLSYRHFFKGSSRFLLRTEYLRHRSTSGITHDTANGYYVFADQRFNATRELGLRYDWSEFPFAPGLHESGVSLIGTNQLTEQTYLRLQLIHGQRPGNANPNQRYNEAWFEWVWGVGPHTHNLE